LDNYNEQEGKTLTENQDDNSSLNNRLLQRADLLLLQGYDQFQTSQFEAALQSWQKSLGIYRELGIRQAEGAVLTNLGLAYEGLGEYAQAIDSLDNALAIAQEIKDGKGEADILVNLGNIYCDLGQYQQAIDNYQQGLESFQKLQNQQGEAVALVNLGNVYQILGDYEKSIGFFENSLKISQEIKAFQEQANALGNLGHIYHIFGNHIKSIEYYQQSLKIKQKLQDWRGIVHTIGRLGLVYGELGEYDKAIKHHQQGLAISEKIKYRIGELDSLKNIGESLLKSGNFEAAEKSLYAAIDIAESLRSELSGGDVQKVAFFETQDFTYRILQKVLIAQNKIAAALEISESGRSRIFVEFLARKWGETVDSQFNITLLKIEEIKQIAAKHHATLVEYSIIYDQFRVEGKLQTKESELFIWVIQPTGLVTFQKTNLKHLWQQHQTTLADFIGITRESIGVGGRDAVLVNIADSTEIKNLCLHELYEILIQPIAEYLPKNTNEKIIFIPHESLFLVPFVALQDSDGKYLIEGHTILSAPSIQILDLTYRQRQRVGKTLKDVNVLVVGNPTMPKVCLELGKPPQQLKSLPGAEREAVEIAKLFTTKAIIGAAATKEVIIKQLTQARIIHLATHGLLDNLTGTENPGAMPSASGAIALALAPSGNDNGLLTAEEILQMQFNAELVVLSACDTGRGRLTGDGVTGLSRSLIAAGVSSIVVSLWSIPDVLTANLMIEFYQNLERGVDKAQALRQAMLTILKQRTNSPRSWAAFILIGAAD
jgi:CHAT domain-containing protein/Tfp pilus assembly protein PilF